jgi:hypothetical protein
MQRQPHRCQGRTEGIQRLLQRLPAGDHQEGGAGGGRVTRLLRQLVQGLLRVHIPRP